MFNFDEKELNRLSGVVYKSAFKEMLDNHVREEQREEFLKALLKTTNQYASSTVWGAVWDIMQETYGYKDKELGRILKG